MKYVKPLKLYQEFLLNKNPIPGLLGLDVCEEYVNLAYTVRTDGYVKAQLLPSFSRKKSIDVIDYLFKHQITCLNLGGIVAGCSCIENKEKSNAGQTKIFIDILCKTGNFKSLKYTYWDRKLTSKGMEIIEGETIESDIKEGDLYGIYLESCFDNKPQKEIQEIEKKLQEKRERMYRQTRATLLLQGFMEYGEMCVGKAYDVIDDRKSEL